MNAAGGQLGAADSRQPGVAVHQRQLPLEPLLGGALSIALGGKVLADGRQVAYVVDGAAQDRNLGDASVAARAGQRVAQRVEVTLEVVSALPLHHVVLGALVT